MGKMETELSTNPLMVGWTTLATRQQADSLAAGLLQAGLAACVHIEAPVTAMYRWKGEIQQETEIRLTVKFPRSRLHDIQVCLKELHPYENPEWLAVEATAVAGDYHRWALAQAANQKTC